MLDIQPEVSSPEVTTTPERKQITLTQDELVIDFPLIAKLGFGHIQHFHLRQRAEKLREQAVLDVLTLVGAGKINTRLLGRNLELSAKSTPWIKAVESKEAEVKAAYQERYQVLKQALADGKATSTPFMELAVIIPSEPKESPLQNTPALEAALAATSATTLDLSTDELTARAPKLINFLYCYLQGKDLEGKLKTYNDQALGELKGKTVTIHTTLNKEAIAIACTQKEDIKPNPEDVDLKAALAAAASSPNKLLKQLVTENLATEHKTFYVLAKALP